MMCACKDFSLHLLCFQQLISGGQHVGIIFIVDAQHPVFIGESNLQSNFPLDSNCFPVFNWIPQLILQLDSIIRFHNCMFLYFKMGNLFVLLKCTSYTFSSPKFKLGFQSNSVIIWNQKQLEARMNNPKHVCFWCLLAGVSTIAKMNFKKSNWYHKDDFIAIENVCCLLIGTNLLLWTWLHSYNGIHQLIFQLYTEIFLNLHCYHLLCLLKFPFSRKCVMQMHCKCSCSL